MELVSKGTALSYITDTGVGQREWNIRREMGQPFGDVSGHEVPIARRHPTFDLQIIFLISVLPM